MRTSRRDIVAARRVPGNRSLACVLRVFGCNRRVLNGNSQYSRLPAHGVPESVTYCQVTDHDSTTVCVEEVYTFWVSAQVYGLPSDRCGLGGEGGLCMGRVKVEFRSMGTVVAYFL